MDAPNLLQVQRISYYDAETDVSLAAFLESASPHQQKTCPHQGCGDGATAHLHSFLHMSGMITLSITQLPPDQELPGGPEGRIWFWARPQGVRRLYSHQPAFLCSAERRELSARSRSPCIGSLWLILHSIGPSLKP